MFSFLEGCGLALALLLPKLVLFVGNPTWLPLVDGFSPLNAIRQWGSSSQSQVAWIEGLYKSVVLLCKIHFFEQKITKASNSTLLLFCQGYPPLLLLVCGFLTTCSTPRGQLRAKRSHHPDPCADTSAATRSRRRQAANGSASGGPAVTVPAVYANETTAGVCVRIYL